MNDEELEIFFLLYQSMIILRKILSFSEDHICQNLCTIIGELEAMLEEEQHRKTIENLFNKLQEINELLLILNSRSSFMPLAYKCCRLAEKESDHISVPNQLFELSLN